MASAALKKAKCQIRSAVLVQRPPLADKGSQPADEIAKIKTGHARRKKAGSGKTSWTINNKAKNALGCVYRCWSWRQGPGGHWQIWLKEKAITLAAARDLAQQLAATGKISPFWRAAMIGICGFVNGYVWRVASRQMCLFRFMLTRRSQVKHAAHRFYFV